MPSPYPMLEHAKAVVSAELRATMQLFSVGNDQLAFSTNRVATGECTAPHCPH